METDEFELGPPVWNGSRAINNGQLFVPAEVRVSADEANVRALTTVGLATGIAGCEAVRGVVRRLPGVTIRQIEAMLPSYSPESISQCLYRLEARGLVRVDTGGEPRHRGTRKVPLRFYTA
jgi:hypothetical protein